MAQYGVNGEPIPIHNFANAQYYGPVSAGTPRQNFNVIYDTGMCFVCVLCVFCERKMSCVVGSSNMWVPGATCKNCGLKPKVIHGCTHI